MHESYSQLFWGVWAVKKTKRITDRLQQKRGKFCVRGQLTNKQTNNYNLSKVIGYENNTLALISLHVKQAILINHESLLTQESHPRLVLISISSSRKNHFSNCRTLCGLFFCSTLIPWISFFWKLRAINSTFDRINYVLLLCKSWGRDFPDGQQL